MKKQQYEQSEDAVCKNCGEPCIIIAVDDSFDHEFGTEHVHVYPASACCEADIIGCEPDLLR